MKKILRSIVTAALLITMFVPAKADEGMWLPLYIKMVSGDMQSKGMKLTADDIYSINHSSIKDAIVQMGSFCTGEIVSEKGLVFTNHHCGYDAIAELSSTESNLLDGGFWSGNFEEEIPVPGLSMSILVYMMDITETVNNSDNPDMIIDSLIATAETEPGYRAEVSSLYYGLEHYLLVYEVFNDIRLVGAPPASVGKFGGDTDNWMWPRHTGDFSIFRIYADADNNPADYSEDNVPYKPKHFLPISLKGVEKDDFAMIMGFPGSTERYITSFAIDQLVKTDYPAYVKILEEKLAIMKESMDKDEAVRLNMASDYASLANSYKYFKGVVEGSGKSDFMDKKRQLEADFQEWTAADDARTDEYGNILSDLQLSYEQGETISKFNDYINFAGFGTDMIIYGINFYRLSRQMTDDAVPEDYQPTIDEIKATIGTHFYTYHKPTDQKILASTLRLMYTDLPEDYHPDLFTSAPFTKMKDNAKGDRFDNYAAYVMKKSMLANEKKLNKFLKKPSKKKLEADPGVAYTLSIIDLYLKNAFSVEIQTGMIEEQMKTFMKGMREMQAGKKFYPDADFSLRLTYGTIKPYNNEQGEPYNYWTDHYGILAKEKPGDEEFDVDKKLHDLLVSKDFGEYARNDTLPVCFISNTDITGGNSGSPVIDGEGNLIGIAFDGNWEAMISDIYFVEPVTRTISVDIRYVMFIIDKFAGAQRLVDEVTLVR